MLLERRGRGGVKGVKIWPPSRVERPILEVPNENKSYLRIKEWERRKKSAYVARRRLSHCCHFINCEEF